MDSEITPVNNNQLEELDKACEEVKRLSLVVPLVSESRVPVEELAELEYLEGIMEEVARDDFTVHMLMNQMHLALKARRKGALDLLINRLIDFARGNMQYVDFYMPQLCLMVIAGKKAEISMRLERFLIEVALD